MMASTIRTNCSIVGYIWKRDQWYAVMHCVEVKLVDNAMPYDIYVSVNVNGEEGLSSRTCPTLAHTRDNPPSDFDVVNPFADFLD